MLAVLLWQRGNNGISVGWPLSNLLASIRLSQRELALIDLAFHQLVRR